MVRFVVRTSAAKSTGKWRHERRNVGVMVVEAEGIEPSSMSENARGLLGMAYSRGGLNVGKTARSEYAIALAEAHQIAATLNKAALAVEALRAEGVPYNLIYWRIIGA